ncbi:MAG: CHAT domain-containing protein [Cyanobacteria bacterium P01_F01_bin.42]
MVLGSKAANAANEGTNQSFQQLETVQSPQENSQILQQGKQYFYSGQFSAAASTLKQAVVFHSSNQSSASHVQALNFLAASHQELGNWKAAETAIAQSLLLVPEETNSRTALLLRAQALNEQGKLQLSQGQTAQALTTWKQAAATYKQANDKTGQIISAINQAQALQTQGKYRQTKSLLEEMVAHLRDQPDSLLKAQGLRSFGVALQLIGDLEQSNSVLEESLTLSKTLDSAPDTSAAYFSLANVAKDLGRYSVAWASYQAALESSPGPESALQIRLNQLNLLLTQQQPAAALMPDIENNILQLSPSRSRIYSRVNLADKLMLALKQAAPDNNSALEYDAQSIARLLQKAVQEARSIQDSRAEAFALNQLAQLYQQQQQWLDAQTVAEMSLQLSQAINADDITARAATQLGRIRQQQWDIQGAIAAYDIAFVKLQTLRSDLVTVNPDVQFTFKESIEPTYRDYVSVLLTNDTQENLKKARQVMEALQLAELDNFFQDACVDSYPVVLDDIDVQAAVIYPIILRDRLEVILSLPNRPLQHYSTPLSPEQVEAQLQTLYSSLSPGYPRDEGLAIAQTVYSWLIKPAEAELKANNSKTLVFVPDGFFRSLPISALYDGDRYLIEKYGVAISPGLQLFPEGLRGKELSLLAIGLTEGRQGFTPLPGVTGEIEQIQTKVESDVLLDREFSKDSFSLALNRKSYPIVHVATHGQFSSDPVETFLLTWNDRISIQDFDTLFQNRKLGLLNPIELLVMSACQTAAGDSRAALGLAGFALRSGARSTVASLWSVSDEATSELMREFYRQLSQGNVSKAEAIRQAQLKVLANPKHKHPYFWSAFVLIGNWL